MTTSSISYRLIGEKELIAKFGRIGAVNALRPAMVKATLLLHQELKGAYPPASGKPFKFVSDKQRRYVMMAIRSGLIQVPYRRRKSGGLKGSWSRSVTTEFGGRMLVGIVGSPIHYGPWVMGPPGTQARYHEGNWPTIDEIAKKVASPVNYVLNKGIQELLKS